MLMTNFGVVGHVALIVWCALRRVMLGTRLVLLPLRDDLGSVTIFAYRATRLFYRKRMGRRSARRPVTAGAAGVVRGKAASRP